MSYRTVTVLYRDDISDSGTGGRVIVKYGGYTVVPCKAWKV